MKTKTFLLLFLFMSLAAFQLSAHNGKNGTGSFSDYYVIDPYVMPVYCNGMQVDVLTDTVAYHFAGQLKLGSWIGCNNMGFGEANSSLTGEVLKVHEIAKQDDILMAGTIHNNYRGSKGTHYVGSFTFAIVGDKVIFLLLSRLSARGTLNWDANSQRSKPSGPDNSAGPFFNRIMPEPGFYLDYVLD